LCLRPFHQIDCLSLVLPPLGIAKDATDDCHLPVSLGILAAEGVQVVLLFSDLGGIGWNKVDFLDPPVCHSLLQKLVQVVTEVRAMKVPEAQVYNVRL